MVPLPGGVLNGDALRSMDSGGFDSGADRFEGFCARVEGFEGTFGLPALLTGGGTLPDLTEGIGTAAPLGGEGAGGFDTSPVWKRAFTRASNPGVAARLSVLAWPLVGESVPD